VEPQSNGTQRFVKPLPQLPLQEESLPSTVKIANAQFEGKVCRYEITFVYSNGEQHSVSRRYSEFDQLRKDILALDSHVLQAVEGTAPRKPSDGIQVSPQPFPTNKWRQTKKVVDARKDSLSGWLNALLPYDSLAPVLMRFLGLSNSRRKTYSRLDGDSELLVQVLRWMYVKDPSKSGKKPYVVYEITVSGPFPGGPTTKVYHQRWSQLYKFQDRFDTWSKRTAKIRENPQRLPSKNTAASDDPQRLQGRTNELNRWAANLSAWANNMSAQGAVELENFLDEVVEPCFGEDRGGKSPTGRRAELDCSEQDHVGWLNLMHQNKSEPCLLRPTFLWAADPFCIEFMYRFEC
jgi:hypothetical protein